MIPSLRKSFNESFTQERFQLFLNALDKEFPGAIEFRIAETPVFVDDHICTNMVECCEHIIDFINSKEFLEKTERSIPPQERVPNEGKHTHFIAFDFGICKSNDGRMYPALIEMQGFPTLFAYHAFYPEVLENHFSIPDNYSNFFNNYTKETYLSLLKTIIVGNYHPKEVVLLEIKPEEQKTRIDFYCTEKYLGIKPICITSVFSEGDKLYYINNDEKIQIKRIYNRVISDELNSKKSQLGQTIDFSKTYDVEWITHPHWFYRISKFTLPFLSHSCIPETKFLNEVDFASVDLTKYVLKPLFSFAGQGVIIDVTKEDIKSIQDQQNWILQRKVEYADCIETPTGPAKAEIRLMYFWEENQNRPVLVNNLARLSKGKMIGVRYNTDKDWVGGSVAYFKKNIYETH